MMIMMTRMAVVVVDPGRYSNIRVPKKNFVVGFSVVFHHHSLSNFTRVTYTHCLRRQKQQQQQITIELVDRHYSQKTKK